MQIVCGDYKCAIAVARTKEGRKHRDKAIKKDHRERKYKLDEIKIRKKAAKLACHAYIRERDKDELCPCCNKPLGYRFQAGHFIESGNFSFIRYHEDNIHGQRLHCNMFKGGDSGDYENNLRIRIGDDRVDWLKENKNKEIKRTAEDYKEIENYYKTKLKGVRCQSK